MGLTEVAKAIASSTSSNIALHDDHTIPKCYSLEHNSSNLFTLEPILGARPPRKETELRHLVHRWSDLEVFFLPTPGTVFNSCLKLHVSVFLKASCFCWSGWYAERHAFLWMNLSFVGCLTFNYGLKASVRVLSIMPKIPEISVGIQMERSVSVSSDRNIRDHLWRWSTYFGWNIPIEIRRSIFDKPVLCPN